LIFKFNSQIAEGHVKAIQFLLSTIKEGEEGLENDNSRGFHIFNLGEIMVYVIDHLLLYFSSGSGNGYSGRESRLFLAKIDDYQLSQF